MSRDGKVVSFINMKGGVGKSTLCLEMADQISRIAKDNGEKYKILLIDIDPQSNLTQAVNEHFFPEEDVDKLKNGMDNLEYVSSDDTDGAKVKKSIEALFNKKPKGLKPEDIIISLPDVNYDIIPGELETIFLERASGNSTSQKLMDFILNNNMKDEYDLIFIDCPPTYSVYTEMAFFISDYYFVPVIPDKYSLLGVDLLERVVADIVENNKNSIFKDRKPKNIGVIFTRVDTTRKPKQNNYMKVLKGSAIVRDNKIHVFNNEFIESNKLSTFDLGKLVSDTDDTKLITMMKRISMEFLSRI